MAWQDMVIAACQFGFVLAFIPTLRSNDKPAVATSVMNVILVLTITFCFITLGLWFSVATASAITVCWAIVAVQKINLDRHDRARK